MVTATERIYGFAVRAIRILGIALIAVLFFGNFIWTCFAKDMTGQEVLTRFDNVLWNILGTAVMAGIIILLAKAGTGISARFKKWLLCLVLLWLAVAGLVLVLFSKTVPAADAMSVYSIAESFAGGSMQAVHPTDSYLSYYPHQVGLAAYYEAVIRIWNGLGIEYPAYHILKCINILWAMLLVFSQYKTVELLFRDDKITCIYLLLAGSNLPVLFYTSFVYGEIPSLALLSIGIWGMLCFLNTKSRLWAAGSLAAFTGSVMLRKNSLVIVLAVLIVVWLQALKEKRTVLLVYGVLCAVCAWSILPGVQKLYEMRAGNSLNTGVPPMAYFAMGMQEASRAQGWYNGYNFDIYQKEGLDASRASQKSKAAIRERLEYFIDNPKYAVSFYGGKLLSQWADGTYACRQATLAAFGGRHALFQEIYEGRYSGYLVEYCNIYQNVLYMGVLIFCLQAFGRKAGAEYRSLPLYLGIICLWGGFLFHILWEANSRYIFMYAVLLLPYCGAGLWQGYEKGKAVWDCRSKTLRRFDRKSSTEDRQD